MSSFGGFGNWFNSVTGQGTSSDHGAQSQVSIRPTKTPHEISALLQHAPLIRVTCEIMGEDIVRAWRKHATNPAFWMDIEEQFDFREIVQTALFFAEGYGGAFIFPRFTETLVREKDLSLPFKGLRNGFLGFKVFAPHELRHVDGISSVKQVNGLPDFYSVEGASNIKIHHSWFFAVKGATRVPSLCHNSTFGFDNVLGQSRVDMLFDDFQRMSSAQNALSHILVKGNIDILKIKGLAEALARCDGTDEMMAELGKLVIQASSTVTGANSFQPMVIDSEESLERKGGNHTGAADIVDALQNAFVAATRIPRTRLLGEQSKGLGNGGDADLINYYDRCSAIRERRVTRLLNWMDSVSAPGKRTNWDYAPLWEHSESELVEIASKQATIDQTYFNLNVPGIASAVRDRLERDGKYIFTNTVESIPNASLN